MEPLAKVALSLAHEVADEDDGGGGAVPVCIEVWQVWVKRGVMVRTL